LNCTPPDSDKVEGGSLLPPRLRRVGLDTEIAGSGWRHDPQWATRTSGLIFIDNGNPGPLMGESPDLAFWQPVNFSPPRNCSDGGATLLGDQSGNIVAHDVVEQ